MSNKRVGLTERFGYWLVLGSCKLISWLPRWFLYNVLAGFISFVLYRIFRYRIKVVRRNLKGSFPEKSAEELTDIEKKYYKYLGELFVDAVSLAGISEKGIRRRIVFEDVERHETALEGKSWIAALAHYGSWEYFGAYQLYANSQVVGVYKALHSTVMDMYYNHVRSRFGLLPVDRKHLLRYMVRTLAKGEHPISVGLISDQYARSEGHHIWFDFLNRKTLFFAGTEKLSARFGLPVYYMDVRREGKARYRARFVEIYDGTSQLPEGEVTRRYARELEKSIHRDPPYWMWSHNRWKYRYDEMQDTSSRESDKFQ